MRAILKTTLVLAGIAAAVPACGSDPADDLTGEWAGQCTIPGDTGSRQAKFGFTEDGKYSQSFDGAGESSGTYTATDKLITVTGTDGEAVEVQYSLAGDSLTLTPPDNATCDLKRG